MGGEPGRFFDGQDVEAVGDFQQAAFAEKAFGDEGHGVTFASGDVFFGKQGIFARRFSAGLETARCGFAMSDIRGNRIGRCAFGGRSARFCFDECQDFAVIADKVEFGMVVRGTMVAGYQDIAEVAKVPIGVSFAANPNALPTSGSAGAGIGIRASQPFASSETNERKQDASQHFERDRPE